MVYAMHVPVSPSLARKRHRLTWLPRGWFARKTADASQHLMPTCFAVSATSSCICNLVQPTGGVAQLQNPTDPAGKQAMIDVYILQGMLCTKQHSRPRPATVLVIRLCPAICCQCWAHHEMQRPGGVALLEYPASTEIELNSQDSALSSGGLPQGVCTGWAYPW